MNLDELKAKINGMVLPHGVKEAFQAVFEHLEPHTGVAVTGTPVESAPEDEAQAESAQTA
jgi:hypothetical protein